MIDEKLKQESEKLKAVVAAAVLNFKQQTGIIPGVEITTIEQQASSCPPIIRVDVKVNVFL